MNSIQFISKPLTWFMAVLLAAFVAGCGGGSTTETAALSSDKAFTSFTVGGSVGVINQSAKTIALTVPFGTAVTALVPTFTITGGAVTIGTPAVAQVSATTANNFTTPKVYVVTAADGSTANYTVTVTVASSSAKAISAFSLAWTTGTPGTATGTISGASSPYAIALTVPNGTNVTALRATFVSTGASVTVGTPAVTQVSGVGGTANNFSGMVPYTVHAADGSTAIYNVTVTVAAASAKAISAFSLAWTTGTPGTATGTISGASSPYAIALTVPNGTNVTALVATFPTTGASVTVGAPAVTQVSGTGGTANDFTGMVAYTVHAADASTAIYNVTVTVAAAVASGPPAVNLLSIATNNFVILATTSITDANPTLGSITGNIGLSPATGSAITVTCAEMQGTNKIHASDASYAVVGFAGCAVPTSGIVGQAILDLGTAYTAASDPATPAGVGASNLNVLAGNLPAGTNFVPGTYTWGSDLNINGTITLTGGASDVWIFQISGNLAVASGASVPAGVQVQLVGGAVASNVFWQVAGASATLGTYSTFNGTILTSPSTLIAIQTGAVLHGRALSGTAVTLDGSTVAP